MLFHFDYFKELELENDDYDKQITLRDAALAWGSWNVELVEAFAFPTLAGYWNSPKKRSLKYEVRMYSITEPTFHKKVYLLLIKPDYLLTTVLSLIATLQALIQIKEMSLALCLFWLTLQIGY